MCQWYKCSRSGKSCAAASGMVTLVREAALGCRVTKVSPSAALQSTEDQHSPAQGGGSPRLLLLMGNKLLKPFFPHFSKQSSHPGEWLSYCAHRHVKLGPVQNKCHGPTHKHLARVPGDGESQRKALAFQQRKADCCRHPVFEETLRWAAQMTSPSW